MLSLVPAFVGGLPGGLELLVIFFIMFLLFGVPVALALILGFKYVRGQAAAQSRAERIEELESELDELRDQVTETAPDDGEPQAESASGDEDTSNDE